MNQLPLATHYREYVEVTTTETQERRPPKSPERPNSSPQTRSWFMSVAVPTRPRCPACGGRMLPKAVMICGDVAWCDICHDAQHSDDVGWITGLLSRAGPSEFTVSRGVTFWTPPATLDDMPIYGRWVQVAQQQRASRRAVSIEDLRAWTDDEHLASVVTESESRPAASSGSVALRTAASSASV